jgi:riboflavin synthase
MFTGLIETVGKVVRIEPKGTAGQLFVQADLPVAEIRLGDSIAVNGACLTVVRIDGDTLCFDVSPETLTCTTLKQVRSGSLVNLERALLVSDRLNGHIVSGHIDCPATIIDRRDLSGNTLLTFRIASAFAKYVVAKGSIAIDGISLTVNSVEDDRFSVNIIPHTLAQTTLLAAKVGNEVNIETDILGKYLERLFSRHRDGGGLSLELLAKSGFM